MRPGLLRPDYTDPILVRVVSAVPTMALAGGAMGLIMLTVHEYRTHAAGSVQSGAPATGRQQA